MDADFENISIDSTSCRVHQSANGGEKSPNISPFESPKVVKIQKFMREWMTLAIHCLSCSPGNDHDSVHAVSLLSQVPIHGSNIPGDQAYGSKTVREHIVSQNAFCTILPKSDISQPWPVDWYMYKEPHLVECFSQKLKWFRRIFTRYDKLDASFPAFVYIASITILLK